MTLQRFGAAAAFVLTIQFLATLTLAIVAWPENLPAGANPLNHLAESMTFRVASWNAALAGKPASFAIHLTNMLFWPPPVILALALRERMPEARHRMLMALICTAITSTLFLAGGVIPSVTFPRIMNSNDTSAYLAASGILLGLVLAGTSAAGTALVLGGSAALSTGRLPRSLAWLLIAAGVVEICEFAVPLFLILDPLLGTVWSVWLAIILLRAKPPADTSGRAGAS